MMKTIIFYLLFFSITGAPACKKQLDPGANQVNLIRVLEYKTNKPLSGVIVSLYTCSDYDFVFGCQVVSEFATYKTNNKGECTISDRDASRANEGIILSRSQYWDTHAGFYDNFMEPEAWVNIALKAGSVYPDTSSISFMVQGERGNSASLTFRAPKDSLFRLRVYGDETNVINWLVFTRPSSCIFYCPTDTLAFGIFSLNPTRFALLDMSLQY